MQHILIALELDNCMEKQTKTNISKKVKKFIDSKNIKTSTYRIQEIDSIDIFVNIDNKLNGLDRN